jgi:P4 family phage/plasmid primase-like protien
MAIAHANDAAPEDDLDGWMPCDDDAVRAARPGERLFALGDHVELATELVKDLGGAADLVHDEGSAWRYDPTGGLWPKVETSEESRIVQSYSGTPTLPNGKALKVKASDVAGVIRLAHDQIARPGFFGDAPAGIAFTDCVVRVSETGLEVVPHSREHRLRAGYPFPYERSALPRRFLSFLADLFRDDADRADKEFFIQEFFGACAVGIAPRYQRACLAYGPEAENGKSTLSEVVTSCMPVGTTSAIAPQDWGQEYRRAMLVGKHLNAVNELPEREIIASEAFKAIVTGDPIVGRVIRESPVMFRPKAGHYFAANRLPGTADQTEGFWRRFVVLTFNRSFKGDPARDPEMAGRLRVERPQIVSWLLQGAARVVRAKGYTIPASHEKALEAWRKSADQVALFVDEQTRKLWETENVVDHGTGGAALYTHYRRWTEKNGHRPLASNRFADRMKDLGLKAKKTRSGMIYPVLLCGPEDYFPPEECEA